MKRIIEKQKGLFSNFNTTENFYNIQNSDKAILEECEAGLENEKPSLLQRGYDFSQSLAQLLREQGERLRYTLYWMNRLEDLA